MTENKGHNLFAQLSSDELKVIAKSCIESARAARFDDEMLARLEFSSRALRAGGLTIESLDMEMNDIFKITNRLFDNGIEIDARFMRMNQILGTYPRIKLASTDKQKVTPK